MMSFEKSWFALALRRLADWVCTRPKPLVWPQLILVVLSVFYTVYALKIDTNRSNVIGEQSKVRQVTMKFDAEFPGGDELVTVVESENPERSRQFVERLGARLDRETNLLSDVFYKGDLGTLGSKSLFLVPVDDLEQMRRKLHDYRPFIMEFARATNLNSFFELVNQRFLSTRPEASAETNSLLGMIPFLERIISQGTQSVIRPGPPPSPGVSGLLGGGADSEQQIYITYNHARIFLLTARARTADSTPKAIERIRALIAQTRFEVPGVNVGLTGEPVLDYDEMRQAEHDSIVASIAALILCCVIFIVAYREVGRPLKTALCLVIGLIFSMGFTTLAVGHLNILSVTFAPMLIGLAIDFGVHFVTRYEEEERNKHSQKEASHRAMVFTGQGIVTGAFTTAAAFLAMALTNFRGIREMGIISGGGLLLCLVPMITLLPILLMREPPEYGQQTVSATERRIRIEGLWLHRPWVVVFITLGLCIAAGFQFRKVHFDYNMLHMQSKGLASVNYESTLITNAGKSLLFAAVMADSPQQAVEYENKLEKLPGVAKVESVADYVTEDQEAKLRVIRSIKNELADIQFPSIDTNPAQVEPLSATLWYLMGFLGLGADAAAESDPALAKQLRSLRSDIGQFRVVLLSGLPHVPKQLSLFQQSFLEDFHETINAIKNQDTSGPLTARDLPPVLRDRFVGITGKYLLQVYSKADVWQHDNQKEFMDELRTVVPPSKTSGTPIELYEYTTLLKENYQSAAYYALIAIAIMVYLHFRSIVCVILALLPVAIGTTWLLGFLGATGTAFNPANIMTLPLVIGIGVTNGIQILNRVAEEQKPGILAKSTEKAVLVSGLTAIAGFGTLILAKHQGIRSLGWVMSVGIASCMIAGLTFLPSLLMIMQRWGWVIPLKEKQIRQR